MPALPGARSRLALAAVLVLFSLPLMLRLGEPEMRSDEAIYSYAVERTLDTGDWLTPRSIPSDEPFLEKPPLKFWIVAAAIKSGLLPRNEAGLRFFDGLFGAVAFIYIFLLGRWLAGPMAGVIAVLVIFTIDPLLFDHGLRSSNMEASVFLSYCGGLYHFARWVESAGSTRRRTHALAVALYFVLGFMTKFVAALFLPLICAAALAWRRDAALQIRSGWRDWVAPAGVVLLLTVPWFVYATALYGRGFWDVIFATHVYTRFAGVLEPSHIHPWHYYLTVPAKEIAYSGSALLVAAGIVRLIVAAVRNETWFARLCLVWVIVPVVLISFGTSKLFHYAYPFLPPVGLGAGFAVATVLARLDSTAGGSFGSFVRWARALVVFMAAAFLILSVWTALAGPVRYEVGSTVWFRNSSVLRPAIFSVLFLWIAGYSTNARRLVAAVALAILLPISAYADKIEHITTRTDHPLRTTRDCVASVQAAGHARAAGVYKSSDNIIHHSYYYYLWRLGPWTTAPAFSAGEVRGRLAPQVPGDAAPVIIQHSDYDTLFQKLREERSDLVDVLKNNAVRYEETVAILLPGPYASCVAPVLAAGGRPIWPAPAAAVR
jgi:4-amino-4-deoxy-L-arabinose transferase-like glycosyltransferase